MSSSGDSFPPLPGCVMSDDDVTLNTEVTGKSHNKNFKKLEIKSTKSKTTGGESWILDVQNPTTSIPSRFPDAKQSPVEVRGLRESVKSKTTGGESWILDVKNPTAPVPSRFADIQQSPVGVRGLRDYKRLKAKLEQAESRRNVKETEKICNAELEEKRQKINECISHLKQLEKDKNLKAAEEVKFKQLQAERKRMKLHEEKKKKIEQINAKRDCVLVQKTLNDLDISEKTLETESERREREIFEKVLMQEARKNQKVHPFSSDFKPSTALQPLPPIQGQNGNRKKQPTEKIKTTPEKSGKKLSWWRRVIRFFRRKSAKVDVL